MKAIFYEDIISEECTPGSHKVCVEQNGIFSEHWVSGDSYEDACKKLVQTGWYINSSRNIIVPD